MTDEPLDPARVRGALDSPTLKLLSAHTAWWVLPLFSEHLEPAQGPVSAAWFHRRVAEALQALGLPDSPTPAEHCRKWVDQDHWLVRSRDADDGRLLYELSDNALRAIQIVRDTSGESSTVSDSRLGSITDAVRRLADMASPDIAAHIARIDARIAELEERRAALRAGDVRPATDEEMRRQFDEVRRLLASLPADFRALTTMIERRHHAVAAGISSTGTPKGAAVEEFLHEHDLLAQTPEGRAYRGFSDLLVSREAESLRGDIDLILDQDAAATALGDGDRAALRTLMSTLLEEEHEVEAAYTRWTASLRRFLTRSSGGRHQRLLTLVDQVLEAGDALSARPGRPMIDDVLGVGTLDVRDMSQAALWQPSQEVKAQPLHPLSPTGMLPEDRELMMIQAGTSTRAVAATVNDLVTAGPTTGARVFAATPEACRRLVVLLGVLDLGLAHGRVEDGRTERVTLVTPGGRERTVLVPLVHFDRPLPIKDGGND